MKSTTYVMLPWSQNGLDGFLGFALGTAVGVMGFFFFTNLLKIYNVPPNTDLIQGTDFYLWCWGICSPSNGGSTLI
jgi:hypothetical protein